MKVEITGELFEATFIRRINRFLAEIEIDRQIAFAHVPNTGRMKELLVEGTKIIVRHIHNTKRKTKYDLLMVYKDNFIVCIDSQLPNVLLEKAFKNGYFPQFEGYNNIRREVQFGSSRFDLFVDNGKDFAFIEGKCVTFVREDQGASFPDAPTERGRKHVLELIEAVNKGIRGAVFFVVQRQDAVYFVPNGDRDPAFSQVVKMAYDAGVEFYAIICNVSKEYIEFSNEIPVHIT
ncbi:MAG: DNA/RNA nuclease SfsA [Bacillota bacterium]